MGEEDRQGKEKARPGRQSIQTIHSKKGGSKRRKVQHQLTNRYSSMPRQRSQGEGEGEQCHQRGCSDPKARKTMTIQIPRADEHNESGTRPGGKTKSAQSGTEAAMTKQRREQEKDRSQPSGPNRRRWWQLKATAQGKNLFLSTKHGKSRRRKGTSPVGQIGANGDR